MTSSMLDTYAKIVGETVIGHLRQLAEPLAGMKVIHVNSTRNGGGVAEILHRLIPLKRELGIDARWEIITGEGEFYECTKKFHNALQGTPVGISNNLLKIYEKTNERNAEVLRNQLEEADIVYIHDPQPAALLNLCPNRKGRWIWRCHIDVSKPYRPVWKYLKKFVAGYDASIFSLPAFAQSLPHTQCIIPPSIDPLSEKNMELDQYEIDSVFNRFNLDPDKPIISQISRFDRFKDPLGVFMPTN